MGRWDGIHFVEVGEERIRMEDLGKRVGKCQNETCTVDPRE